MNRGRKRDFCRAFRRAPVFTVGVLLSIYPFVAKAKLNVGVSSTNYLGQGNEGREASYSALDLTLDAETKSNAIDSRAFVQSQIGFNDSSYRFVEFPELYVATSRSWLAPMRYTVGRKIEDWSLIDETWGTGAFQPRFRWDYLRPQEVGLLGLYQEFERGPFRATLFYSPVFVPDRGAPLDFADGRIRSVSPWVVNPPYEIEVMRKKTPVHYEARIPKIGEIVRQDSVAGHVSLGNRSGAWGAASYAYKPMNQLLMSYEPYLPLDQSGPANVVLYPRVAYHHLAGADVGYRAKSVSGSLSFLADLPRDEAPSPSRTSQQVGNLFSVSPSLQMNVFGHGTGAGGLTLSYLRVFGKDPADSGLLSDGKTSQFDSRYPYKNAFLFSTRLPTWRRLSTDARLLLDMEHPGTIVSWNFQYAPSREWKLFLSTDVLSSYSNEGDGTNFIRRYRENDRVAGGVTYDF
jgi:hypothetical protein